MLRSFSRRSILLVILAALLQIIIFPIAGILPVWRSALSWIALAPFLLALLLPDSRGLRPGRVQSFLLGYLCGFLWYLGNCFWIYQTMYLYGGLPKPIALCILLLFALYLGLYHALFAVLLQGAASSCGPVPALLFAPFLWVAIEFARTRITGFPWDLLGYSQIDNLLLTKLSPVAGVMSISFVLLATNAALAACVFLPRRRSFITGATATVIALTCQGATGWVPITTSNSAVSQATAILLQENLAVGATGISDRPESTRDELVAFAALSRNASNKEKPAVIVWPEAPSHFQTGEAQFQSGLSVLAHDMNSPIIAGSLGVDADRTSPRGYSLYDSASVFNADGTVKGRYDKVHLVPWGEYIPFEQVFSFAHKLTEGAGNMDRGTTRPVFSTGGHTYGVFICYESIFGDEVKTFAAEGAEVLVNISDDGWYGDTGAPWQHLNMARMRAIENHKWVLRSTNTGITTAIDPQGRVTAAAPRHVRGAYAFPFQYLRGTTFYTRHGEWFAWLCGVLSALVAGLTLFRTNVRPSIQ